MNHDAQAARYDRLVADETHPVRAGYAACLDWVASHVASGERVLDLGSGTGNLALRLPPCRLTCVDVSAQMTRIARAKLARPAGWVQEDLVAYLEAPRGPFDAVISTYAVHHLAEGEKLLLFRRIRAALAPGGRAAFGDLMFENLAARERLLARYAGDRSVADSIRDEFYWDLSTAVPALERLGFRVETRRFSDLSWGLAARALP
ncbi:MAG TPA: class I SAM-dependent methyltransferase [Planctomycetota bacterium]|nr:class I SAM-dependent methyltransferase [Planctomycetota bacterium]